MVKSRITRYLSARLRKILLSEQELELLIKLKQNSCFPPGHFYSPIVDTETILKNQNTIWPDKEHIQSEVRLNDLKQLELLSRFKDFYPGFPYINPLITKLRYKPENTFFDPLDAFTIYSFIRHFHPGKILEIGSGYSSAVMLDTNQYFENNNIRLTFIEPYPERLKSLLQPDDYKVSEIVEKELQDIPLVKFRSLNKDDILFIDSTHVCKTGSDLNYLFFKVLPVLNSGVIIHFHDIFNSFEYPRQWVLGGRNWNESYILRTFLMYNDIFQILFFNDYLFIKYYKELSAAFPYPNLTSGGSIFLIKN